MYSGEDFYCDVAIPRAEPIAVVHEDARILAFHHTVPTWETHIVVVPKQHIGSLTTVTSTDRPDVEMLLGVVQGVAASVEREHGAASVVTNLGACQDSKHLHVHVHSGARIR